MGIAKDLSRVKSNITAALSAIAEKGVTVPDGSNSDALAELIASIEAGGGNGIVYTSGTLTFTSSTECENHVITHGLGVTPQIFILCSKYAPSANYALYSFGVISEGLRNLGYTASNFAYYYANKGINMYCRIDVGNNTSITIDESTITIPSVNNGVFVSGVKYSWHAIGGIEA